MRWSRLNWGCGPKAAPGWLNSDRLRAPGVDVVADIRNGLPLAGGSIDYAVAIHVLQDLPYLDVVPALRELRRVLKPGGVLRVAVPDLERAIRAWLTNDPAYFYVGDDEVRSIGGKLIVQATWYGSVRTPFTWDFLRELLERAGLVDVERCAYRRTASPYPGIVELDNRERETVFAEGAR